MADGAAQVRPLRVRTGARFACAGDGLCCTDVHALGPLTRREVRALEAHRAGVTERHPLLAMAVLAPARGACPLLGPAGCTVHTTGPTPLEPAACRRFPLGLVATPEGGRVTTAHRCPCRTLGARPPLDVAGARRALLAGGRLRPDREVPARLLLAKGRGVSFARYAAVEETHLQALGRGELPFLHATEGSLPPLDTLAWEDVGHQYRAMVDGTAAGEALATFGDALLAVVEERRLRLRARPWAAAFDRAEARSAAGDPHEVLTDWLADEVYAIPWAGVSSFDRFLRALAARYRVALALARALEATGARADRAAAEAVLVAEIAGAVPLGVMVMRG